VDPLPLPPEDGGARANLRTNRLHAGLQAVTANMLAPFIGLLALRLGATNLQLGALSALPNLLTFCFTLPIIAGLDARTRHGPVLGRAFLASRLLFLALAAVPLFAPPWTAWALVAVWGLHNFPFNAANSVIQGFLADLVPAEQVGNALAQRGVVSTVAAMATVLILGELLDRLPFPAGYQWVAVAACLIGLAEVYSFTRFVEPQRQVQRPSGRPWWERLRAGAGAVRSQERFVAFLVTAVAFNFTWTMVWPMFNRYQADVLGADNLWFALVSVAGSLGGIFTFQAWSRQAQRTSPARAMVWATLILSTAPLATRLAPSILWVVIYQLVVGVSVAGVTLLLLQASLYYAPTGQRSIYLAVYQTGMMGAAVVAPLVGGGLMDLIGTGNSLVVGTVVRAAAAGLWWHLGRRDSRPGAS